MEDEGFREVRGKLLDWVSELMPSEGWSGSRRIISWRARISFDAAYGANREFTSAPEDRGERFIEQIPYSLAHRPLNVERWEPGPALPARDGRHQGPPRRYARVKGPDAHGSL
jgi:hypothetical protein